MHGDLDATSLQETVACLRGLGPSPSPLQSGWSQIGTGGALGSDQQELFRITLFTKNNKVNWPAGHSSKLA